MTRIEYRRYCTMIMAANKMFYESGISICDEKTEKDGKYRKVTAGINWGGHGTVSAIKAQEHLEAMSEALRVVNMINSMEIEYYFDDVEGKQIEDEYDKLFEGFLTAFRINSLTGLKIALGGTIGVEDLPDVYPEGYKVKLVGVDDPNYDMVDGVEGTVVYVEEERIHISCDC